MKTFSELVTKVKLLTAVSDKDDLIKDAINWAHEDICSNRDFSFFIEHHEFDVEKERVQYALPIGLQSISFIYLSKNSISFSLSRTVPEKIIQCSLLGVPRRFAQMSDALYIGDYTAHDDYDGNLYYYRLPETLVADGDVPELAARFGIMAQEAIVSGAVHRFYVNIEEEQKGMFNLQKYETDKIRLYETVLWKRATFVENINYGME